MIVQNRECVNASYSKHTPQLAVLLESSIIGHYGNGTVTKILPPTNMAKPPLVMKVGILTVISLKMDVSHSMVNWHNWVTKLTLNRSVSLWMALPYRNPKRMSTFC